MTNMSQTSLLEVIPENLLQDEKVTAAALAMDSELKLLLDEIDRLSRYSRMNQLTSEEADELAWEFHIDFYDPALPLEKRRELVKNAITWHQRKGTPRAVEELITTLFGYGKVEEWWEYDGKPFHFRVLTDNPEVTNEKASEFIQAVDSIKRLTAILDRIILSQSDNMPLYIGGILHMGEKMTIGR